MKPPTIQVQALYRCAFCGRMIAPRRRLSYPTDVRVAAVYRFSFGKHSGAPEGKG